MKNILSFNLHEVSQEELQKIAIVGTHLHKWQGKDTTSIPEVFEQQAMVQLDPLNPAGRYHDFFFSSRMPNYRRGEFEKTVYTEKLVFETYFHNLNAINIDFFPLFYSRTLDRDHLGRYYSRALKILEEAHPQMLDQVLDYVRIKGATRGSDLTELGKADPKYAVWKTSRNSGTALELLWAIGKLAVLRDENFRKTYDLIENYIEKSQLTKKSFSEEEQEFLKVKLRMRSFPVTPTGRISIKKNGKIR